MIETIRKEEQNKRKDEKFSSKNLTLEEKTYHPFSDPFSTASSW